MELPANITSYVSSHAPFLFYTDGKGGAMMLTDKASPKKIAATGLDDDSVIVIFDKQVVAVLRKGERDPRQYQLIKDLKTCTSDNDFWFLEDYYQFCAATTTTEFAESGRSTRASKK